MKQMKEEDLVALLQNEDILEDSRKLIEDYFIRLYGKKAYEEAMAKSNTVGQGRDCNVPGPDQK